MRHDVFPYYLLVFFFFILPTPLWADNFPIIPYDHYYVDSAQLLSPHTAILIDKSGQTLWHDYHIPLAVVTIPSLAAENAYASSINKYASDLMNNWHLGTANGNKGMLLLIDYNDHLVYIQLGKNWDKDDVAKAEAIIKNIIIPSFKNNNYDEGIQVGIQQLVTMINQKENQQQTSTPSAPFPDSSSLSAPNKIQSIADSSHLGILGKIGPIFAAFVSPIFNSLVNTFGPLAIFIMPVVLFILFIVLPLVIIATIASLIMPQRKKTIWMICGGFLIFLIYKYFFNQNRKN